MRTIAAKWGEWTVTILHFTSFYYNILLQTYQSWKLSGIDHQISKTLGSTGWQSKFKNVEFGQEADSSKMKVAVGTARKDWEKFTMYTKYGDVIFSLLL